MIIIRIHGGLGNQMFEYTFYRYMEKKYPGLIKADVTWFDRNHKVHQGYELENVFDIKLDIATYDEIARIHEYYPKYYPLALLRFLARKNAKRKNRKFKPSGEYIMDFGPTQYIKNDEFDSLDTSKDWYIEGVFCSDSYLKLLDESPSELFKFKNLHEDNMEISKKMRSENSVAIHVRRGDYVGNVFDVVGVPYYEKAVSIIRQKVDNPVFYVFSDDMSYIKENFGFLDNYVSVHNEGKASYTDMQLISMCKHMIVANSSFSFWGAAIGEGKESIIIAPKKYKADEEVSLSRENWILI